MGVVAAGLDRHTFSGSPLDHRGQRAQPSAKSPFGYVTPAGVVNPSWNGASWSRSPRGRDRGTRLREADVARGRVAEIPERVEHLVLHLPHTPGVQKS